MQIRQLKTKDLNSIVKKKIFNLKKQSWKHNFIEQKNGLKKIFIKMTFIFYWR